MVWAPFSQYWRFVWGLRHLFHLLALDSVHGWQHYNDQIAAVQNRYEVLSAFFVRQRFGAKVRPCVAQLCVCVRGWSFTILLTLINSIITSGLKLHIHSQTSLWRHCNAVPHWWLVNVASGNGLVTSGKVDQVLWRHVASRGNCELRLLHCSA